MPRFDELLKDWNGGVIRGAQSRFAERVGVTQGTVARWISGGILPGEDLKPRVAKELGVSVETLMLSLPQAGLADRLRRARERVAGSRRAGPDPVLGRLDQLTKQIAELQEVCGELKYRMTMLETAGKKTADGQSPPRPKGRQARAS